MNDVYVIALFVINNVLWGIFVYIFTPRTEKEKISLPKVTLPKIHPEPDGSELVDVDEAPSAVEVLKAMGVKSQPKGEHYAGK